MSTNKHSEILIVGSRTQRCPPLLEDELQLSLRAFAALTNVQVKPVFGGTAPCFPEPVDFRPSHTGTSWFLQTDTRSYTEDVDRQQTDNCLWFPKTLRQCEPETSIRICAETRTEQINVEFPSSVSRLPPHTHAAANAAAAAAAPYRPPCLSAEQSQSRISIDDQM
ncbi:uncharacterized protein V6R79_022899 [Siganus canaliculatus]